MAPEYNPLFTVQLHTATHFPLFLMLFSDFGSKFREGTGIGELMRDLADLPENGNFYRLGGGNPANLASVTSRFQQLAQQSINNSAEFERAFTRYGAAQGDKQLINYLVDYLNQRYDWQLKPHNIALTNGSQNAFFMLFNLHNLATVVLFFKAMA